MIEGKILNKGPVNTQGGDGWKLKYDCYLKTCAYPGLGKEYRCNDEAGLGFPSHCPCACHKEKKGV